MSFIYIFSTKLLQSLRIKVSSSSKKNDLKVRPFLKTQRKSSIFKKMLFTETNEITIGHLHLLFFVFAANEAFFDKFL